MALGASKEGLCLPVHILDPQSLPTHDLAEASLHLHVGLTMFMDVGLAVLTAESKLVIDLKGGEHLSELLDAPFPLYPVAASALLCLPSSGTLHRLS